MDDYQLNKGDVKQLFLSVMNGVKEKELLIHSLLNLNLNVKEFIPLLHL